jgi:hypothetical protein
MLTIPIKKADRSISVDESMLPDHVRAHIFEYGLKQKLNDSVSTLSTTGSASTTKASPDEIFAAVQATLDRLMAGDIRATRAIDSLGKECMRIAMNRVIKRWQKANPGRDLKSYETRNADAAADLAANREAIERVAQATLDLITDGDDE